MSVSITDATTKVFEVLQPLASEERIRVVQAVLTLLGENAPRYNAGPAAGPADGPTTQADEPADGAGISRPARAWARKYDISVDVLLHYFDISDGKASLIGLPGDGKERKERALTTYLMTGIAKFLATGEATFSDEEAREFCIHFGCYDRTNHSKYLKDVGNKVIGSKADGWKLTAPGLAAAAALLKQ